MISNFRIQFYSIHFKLYDQEEILKSKWVDFINRSRVWFLLLDFSAKCADTETRFLYMCFFLSEGMKLKPSPTAAVKNDDDEGVQFYSISEQLVLYTK